MPKKSSAILDLEQKLGSRILFRGACWQNPNGVGRGHRVQEVEIAMDDGGRLSLFEVTDLLESL